jgi:hypothetical protein
MLDVVCGWCNYVEMGNSESYLQLDERHQNCRVCHEIMRAASATHHALSSPKGYLQEDIKFQAM